MWGVTFDVPLPVETYDAVHAEALRQVGSDVDGLLVHLAHATPGGFAVLEVWRSRVDFDHYNATVVGPALARVTGQASSSGGLPLQEFEVRGLVIPQGGIQH